MSRVAYRVVTVAKRTIKSIKMKLDQLQDYVNAEICRKETRTNEGRGKNRKGRPAVMEKETTRNEERVKNKEITTSGTETERLAA